MYKIKMIGPRYVISTLQALGIEVSPAESEKDADYCLDKVTEKKEPSLIFISERLAVDLHEKIEKLNQKPEINIVLIPDNRGSSGSGEEQINMLIKNAIGGEVLKK